MQRERKKTNLEALVLKDLLDGNILTILGPTDEPCLEDDTKRAISDDLAASVGDFFLVTRLAVGCDHSCNLVGVVDCFG